jgi:zinc/manganese transport system permease protein
MEGQATPWFLLLAPFVACLVLAPLHCYVGMHIVRRGVIFIDLSLAQVAALGTTVGLLAGFHDNPLLLYATSLLFAFAGAFFFAFVRTREEVIPQEAIIGIVYVVASAAAVLVLQRTPHGGEELKEMLVGAILFVTWLDILKAGILFAVLAILHTIFRRQLLAVSFEPRGDYAKRLRARVWDSLFYVLFALLVTTSVRIGGILLVFSWLIVPTVAALLFTQKLSRALVWAIVFSVVANAIGLIVSGSGDLPTGACLVTALGGLLAVAAIVRGLFFRRPANEEAAVAR